MMCTLSIYFMPLFCLKTLFKNHKITYAMRKNDKICNQENMEYKPLHRTCNNLIQDFFAKDINSIINFIDKSLIKMFTTKTTKQQLCMFHAICFKASTHFFLQVVATHPSHHRNLQQQPCCITSNVAQACTSNTICG